MNTRILIVPTVAALILCAGGCMQEGKNWYGQNKDDSTRYDTRSNNRNNNYNNDRNWNNSTARGNASDLDEMSRMTSDSEGYNNDGRMSNSSGSMNSGSMRNNSSDSDDMTRMSNDRNNQNRNDNRYNDRRTGDGRDMQGQSGGAWANNTTGDAAILAMLHAKNQEEIAAGKLAQDRSESSQVRDFGKTLVNHHTENDKMVMKHASRLGVDLDDKMAKDGAKRIKGEFENVQGSDFDRQFAMKMRDGHREVIRQVEAKRASAQDPQLKEFLGETLTTLRTHETTAARLASGNMNNTTTDGSMSADRMEK